MKKLFRNKKTLWCSWFGASEFINADFEKYKEAHGLYIEDPWERVKSMFTKDAYGAWHPELVYVWRNIQIGAFAGFIYGGVLYGVKEQQNYVRASDTEIFANKKQAHKTLLNHGVLCFGKEGLKCAPRFAFFCGSFTFISSCFALYRNKHGVIENTFGGAIAGAMCKLLYGIKGITSGGIFGGLLGTIYGVTVCFLENLFHKDRLELKYAHFAYAKYKERLKNSNHSKKTPSEDLHALHENNSLDNFKVEKEKSNQNEKEEEEEED